MSSGRSADSVRASACSACTLVPSRKNIFALGMLANLANAQSGPYGSSGTDSFFAP